MYKQCLGCGGLFPMTTMASRARCPACNKKYRAALSPSAINQGHGWQWSKIRAQVLAAEPMCRQCGAPAAIVDHIVSRRHGGTDDPRNLQSLCHRCHNHKTRGG